MGSQWEELKHLLVAHRPSGHHPGGRQQDWGPNLHLPGPEDRLDWGAGSHAHAQLAQVGPDLGARQAQGHPSPYL